VKKNITTAGRLSDIEYEITRTTIKKMGEVHHTPSGQILIAVTDLKELVMEYTILDTAFDQGIEGNGKDGGSETEYKDF
jgi:hypothetical protein